MSRVTNLSKLRQERMKEINLRNKERERMREQEKAAREREARYSNGHLFTSMTVSGTTLCTACNKSITAKEALSCPTCNVTIHNRCRDTLPNCFKMKQRQQKMTLMRNTVPLRSRTPGMRERPTSAIYPSDSLRQSLLGSRRGRSSLSLSKSVSTNNIAGTLTDDSPLGIRRILSQSTDSLNLRARAMSVESLNDDGENFYTTVLEELEVEGQDFKADSWSMAVDSCYLQAHRKNVIRRQDVIYELIQTEMHHMRTLHIMDRVFRQGMLEELQLEPSIVYAMFPCLDQLIRIHSHFLSQLLLRRNLSLHPGSTRNFTIHQLGDILLEQFSDQCADEMRRTYAEFCSRHLKAVKLYKDLLARDKRFQLFIRRLSRGPLLRLHGVQECILLVTQRISKYPVLIQRILDNTTDDEEEASFLAQALLMIRELLSSVDQQMEELEKTQRMQEIQAKLDPRAETQVRDGGLFRPAELLRRRLVHEGNLFWKTPGSRLKDIQVLLMTDILVFLQEKDQKYIFPSLDKAPVLPLQNLIVRDIANQERGMFLISDSTPPEMYEFHASTKEEKNAWMRHIQHAVSRCPSREEFPLIEPEHKAHLRRLKADLQQKDREMLEILQERVMLFSELAEVMSDHRGLQPPITRYLFRADTPQAPRAEKLLLDATAEVDRISELLLGSTIDTPILCHHNHMELSDNSDQDLQINGGAYFLTSKDCIRSQDARLPSEVCQRLVNLGVYLHALQGAVIKQDSILELLLQPPETVAASPTGGWRSQWRDGGPRNPSAESTMGELALLQRQHSLLQEELLRLRDADTRFKDSEKARVRLEKEVRHLKVCTAAPPGPPLLRDQAPPRRPGRDYCTRGDAHAPKAVHQSEDFQDGSDVEVQVTSDDDDEDDDGGSASESSKDLQDIPEEM
ncbi:LOW QUALITY PROTEIN: rho guanine nucleotide exchange factor 2-like [Gouania willdenowi]|uniref:LOW QUALITY PROTEIN: rho guanine nucleotide exchange factor 2-like n=1 Tax=Gouania willdenowi TaxID=441366 RepID=UPI001055D9CA|nr:LOW QUALITY PROTEIN: rho guanine nucleotide exchange factor 2-like [Gouania willdenowi]